MPTRSGQKAKSKRMRKLDPEGDFDEPVKREPKRSSLVQALEKSPAVQNGKMSAHFVKFSADRTKDRSRIVHLYFSLELEEAHEGRLPREIEDEWKHFRRGSVKRTDPSGMGAQNLELGASPDSGPDLSCTATLPKAVISRITQKGQGKERKVIRLQLEFVTGFTAEVERFCRANYDEKIWLVIEESQGRLRLAEEQAPPETGQAAGA